MLRGKMQACLPVRVLDEEEVASARDDHVLARVPQTPRCRARERGRESVCERERERARECACERERGRERVCVTESAREQAREGVCVCEREKESESV